MNVTESDSLALLEAQLGAMQALLAPLRSDAVAVPAAADVTVHAGLSRHMVSR